MPRKRLQRIEAWSDNRRRDYNACPQKAYLKHVQKLREPEGPAMTRGQRIHDEAEDYAVGKIDVMPSSCELFDEEFDYLRSIRRYLEREKECAVTRTWEPCDWFGSDAWLRAKFDLAWLDPDEPEVYHVVDLKTGKLNPQNTDQLDLYAPVAFAHVPEQVELVVASLWYLDHGVIWGVKESEPCQYDRDDAARLRKQWEKRTKCMLNDTQFKPTPGVHCQWCWFGQAKKAKGGPGLCKF